MAIPLFDTPAALAYLPRILGDEEEFAALTSVEPSVVAAVCRYGYMPMAFGDEGPPVLLVKCHHRRAVLEFENLHVPRNTARYARDLRVGVDIDFAGTLADVLTHHSEPWISTELARALVAINEAPIDGVCAHSVELYDGDRRVAGEIGYVYGGVYTSLSGFHTRNGSGTAQMVALAAILEGAGCAFWDLGMEMEYKDRLGATYMARDDFLQRYRGFGETAAYDAPRRRCALPRGMVPEGVSEIVRRMRRRP
ncbi:MAG: hypothetical protein MI724_08400 [Spirochaetales bacterium]|nr:hypothetical protein [Spirochaetales bacterium]